MGGAHQHFVQEWLFRVPGGNDLGTIIQLKRCHKAVGCLDFPQG